MQLTDAKVDHVLDEALKVEWAAVGKIHARVLVVPIVARSSKAVKRLNSAHVVAGCVSNVHDNLGRERK